MYSSRWQITALVAVAAAAADNDDDAQIDASLFW